MTKALIFAPKTARRGEVIEIRAVIAHAMETGHRPGSDGQVLPRNIIRRVECRYDGALVFAADLHPAIAANPLLSFHTVATASGTLSITWTGDNGFAQTESVALSVA
ncbi:thiosulfate oxidation carrier complex protein SoxZ [Rubrivivax sp. RP6-9]|uniref:thiosulfate oxidation carrier complex protein SoxZ n=1 Tax=Rubrivivax sp. RP6-9 TaxID=3415750 RepID=UPI003CC69028